jgi:CubicO group peptidase (beta-lactamase class C family)
LIPFRPFYRQEGATRDTVLLSIYADTLIYEPGTDSRYSDFGPIVLAEVVERITGQPFASWTRDHIFEPLGMRNTGFRAADSTSDPDVVPTELDDYFRNRLVQGVVHDENAYLLGGTAGHAGLFSNVEDLARFAHMIIREGRVGSERFLRPETVRLFTTPVDKDGAHSRALGWDTKSPSGYSSAGRYFGRRSFGHTGFTGTSIWFDPDQSLYVILLTNRVYPTRENSKHVAVRPDVAEIVYRALEAASPAGPARAAEPARAH